MATPIRDKYYLRTLHEEIGLFDRKLAHLQKYENFASDQERNLAVSKLTTKREQLVRTAREMTEQGIEFKNSEIPRSLRPEDAAPEPPTAAPVEAATPAFVVTPKRSSVSAQDGIVLDFRNEIKEYIERRKKTPVLVPEA